MSNGFATGKTGIEAHDTHRRRLFGRCVSSLPQHWKFMRVMRVIAARAGAVGRGIG
jgi:hypothetical protein